MTNRPAPTEEQINDSLKELAWLALGFFQALLSGEAKVVVDHRPYHDRSMISTSTRVSLEWNRSEPDTVPDETV